jgi:sn-glycerol 3-phosphate transport system substrate-binding protein
MLHRVRPSVIALSLMLACSPIWAKPAAKSAAKSAAKPVSQAPADFELAHNLGPLGEEQLQAVVDRFNKENGGNLKLSRLEKGEKPAGLNLVRRYDMSDILAQSKSFVPLYEMMKKAGEPLNVGDLSVDLKAGVVDGKGRLVALPLVYSTPVLFYNKNALRKAKLDPDQPPKTWFEMQGVLDKLQDAGYTCPYTSSWPVWVHVDNVSAVSGVPAVGGKGVLNLMGCRR